MKRSELTRAVPRQQLELGRMETPDSPDQGYHDRKPAAVESRSSDEAERFSTGELGLHLIYFTTYYYLLLYIIYY